MFGRRSLSPKATMDDAVSYLTAVKEAFHDEPAKFKEFLKLLNVIKAQRMYKDSGIARMTELIKGHPKLLLGLSVFLPEAKNITIPTKANKRLGKSQTIFSIKVSPELMTLNKPAYIASVREAFRNESAKNKEWTKTMLDFKYRRVDEASIIAKVEGLLKNHRNLLLGFSVFISAGAKITIPPEVEVEVEVEHHIAASDDKRDDPDYDPDFENKRKKRKRKGKNMSPPKKKVKLSKRTIHCKKCGQVGHNSRSCGKRARQVCGRRGSQMKSSQSQQNTP